MCSRSRQGIAHPRRRCQAYSVSVRNPQTPSFFLCWLQVLMLAVSAFSLLVSVGNRRMLQRIWTRSELWEWRGCRNRVIYKGRSEFLSWKSKRKRWGGNLSGFLIYLDEEYRAWVSTKTVVCKACSTLWSLRYLRACGYHSYRLRFRNWALVHTLWILVLGH